MLWKDCQAVFGTGKTQNHSKPCPKIAGSIQTHTESLLPTLVGCITRSRCSFFRDTLGSAWRVVEITVLPHFCAKAWLFGQICVVSHSFRTELVERFAWSISFGALGQSVLAVYEIIWLLPKPFWPATRLSANYFGKQHDLHPNACSIFGSLSCYFLTLIKHSPPTNHGKVFEFEFFFAEATLARDYRTYSLLLG